MADEAARGCSRQALPAVAATPVPSGKWSFVFTDKRGQADRPLRVYTYRPRQCDSTCPIVFAMHGKKRMPLHARDNWELAADRHGFMVIAPEFSDKHWPKAADYNLGDVADDSEPREVGLLGHRAPLRRDARRAEGLRDLRPLGRRAVRAPAPRPAAGQPRLGRGRRQRRLVPDAGVAQGQGARSRIRIRWSTRRRARRSCARALQKRHGRAPRREGRPAPNDEELEKSRRGR